MCVYHQVCQCMCALCVCVGGGGATCMSVCLCVHTCHVCERDRHREITKKARETLTL